MDSDATARTKAPEVRVGQRWTFTASDGSVCQANVAMVNGVPRLVTETGDPYMWGPSDRDIGHQWTLLADVPPAAKAPDAPTWWYCVPCDVRVAASLAHVCKPPAPAMAPDRTGPPEGYVPCPKKCGRWTFGTLPCWACYVADGKTTAELAASSRSPDWTPPIEAKAPGRKAGCRCTTTSWCVFHSEERHQRLYGKPAPSPVAQQAKVCSRGDGRGATSYSFDGREMLWCSPCINEAKAWNRAQTGEPGDPSRPELLPRARLAVDWFDDCLDEVRR